MIHFLRRLRARSGWALQGLKAFERKQRLRSFGAHALGLAVRTTHGLFIVDPEDGTVGGQLLRTGQYNPAELERVETLLPGAANVLVVGGHIGTFVVPLSKRCETMVVLEANPNTFALLQANLRLNDCANVTAHNLAAAEAAGKIRFLVNRDNSGGSKRVPKTALPAYYYDHPTVIEVDAVALDELTERKQFDLIFMDIEGSEYFAFLGMPRILAESSCLVVEFIAHHLRNVAGVDSDRFLAPLLPHFAWLYIPEQERLVGRADMAATLRRMYDADECHDGIMFFKSDPPDWIAVKAGKPPV